MMPDTPVAAEVRTPARWRWKNLRRLGRVAIWCTLVLSILVVAMPWLIPKPWLGRVIAGEIGRLMNRTVRIEGLSLGWVQGVIIEGLTIDERPEFGPGPFVRVERVQTEFSPLKLLMGKPISRLWLDRPEVWVVILDENGVQRLNIADLGAEGTQTAPSGEWTATRAAIHVVEEKSQPVTASQPTTRNERNEIALRLGQLACRMDGQTGIARWDIRGQLPTADRSGTTTTQLASAQEIRTEGQLSVPRLKKDVQLNGGGKLTWNRLDLGSIPLHLIPGIGMRKMTGWSAGTLEVQVHEDLSLDWRVHTDLSDVSTLREGLDQPGRLAQARFSANGRWDPAADILALDDFDCRIPGLHVQGSRQADHEPLRVALHSDRQIDLDVDGQADDIELLRQSLPEFDRLLGSRTQARGACRFAIGWTRTSSADSVQLELDGERCEVRHPDRLNLPVGDRARVRIHASVDRQSRHLDLKEALFELGPTDLRVNGRVFLEPLVALPAGATTDQVMEACTAVLNDARGQVRLSTRAAEQLKQYLPFLAEPLHDIRLGGVMSASLSLDSSREFADAHVLSGEMALPESAALAIREDFSKPVGQPLSVLTHVVWQSKPQPLVRHMGLDMRCGPARLWIDPSDSGGRLAIRKTTSNSPGTSGPASTSAISPQEGITADAYVFAAVRAEKVDKLLDVFPALAGRVRSQYGGAGPSGDGTVRLDANIEATVHDGQWRPEIVRLRADADASRLGVDLGSTLFKRTESPAVMAIDYRYDRSSSDARHRYESEFRLAGLSGSGRLVWGNGSERVEANLDATDVEQALAHAPSLRERLEVYRLKGGASVNLRSVADANRQALDVQIDTGNLALHVPGQEPFDKPAGVPCRLSASIEGSPKNDPDVDQRLTIRQVEATLASCRFRATDGQIITRPGTGRNLTAEAIARNPRWWLTESPFRRIDLATTGTLVLDSTLRSLSPALDRFAKKYDLMGSAETSFRLGFDSRAIRLAGRIDADRINLNAAPHLIKTPGTRLSISFDAAGPEPAQSTGTMTPFVVRQCAVEAWDMRITGQGDFWLTEGAEGRGPQFGGFNLTAQYDVPDLSHIQRMIPSLVAHPIGGSLQGNMALAVEGGQFRLGPSHVKADGVFADLGDRRLTFGGQIEASSDRIDCDELIVGVGANRLKLAAHVEEVGRSPRGSFFVLSDEIDFDQLRETLAKLQPAEATTKTSEQERIIRAQPIFEFLKRCDLTARGHIGNARLTGEKTRKVFTVHELISDFKVAAGRVLIPFTCAMNGGIVDGEFSLTADQRNPWFDLKYKAVGVAAEENIKAMVLYDFPGLHATGPVTLIDRTHQRFFTEPDQLNYPEGEGDWIIDGGAYVGRAAPLWLTRLFPGLNTARYEFSRMHDWFKKAVDGRIDHHMIYQGKSYNIYMKGVSFPNGASYYEVGIDLLAGYESKYWSETGQGRVALFTADALVENGVEVRKDIQFVPLHRVIYDVFLRSNVVTAAYYAIKKQVDKP